MHEILLSFLDTAIQNLSRSPSLLVPIATHYAVASPFYARGKGLGALIIALHVFCRGSAVNSAVRCDVCVRLRAGSEATTSIRVVPATPDRSLHCYITVGNNARSPVALLYFRWKQGLLPVCGTGTEVGDRTISCGV
jgi:hypothetical protein